VQLIKALGGGWSSEELASTAAAPVLVAAGEKPKE